MVTTLVDMSKTNYEEIDKFIENGLLKMQKEKLLEQAGLKSPQKQGAEKESTQLEKAKETVLNAVKRDLNRLLKKDKEMYTKLGISRQKISKIIDSPKELSAEQWKMIKQIHDKLEQFKKEMLSSVEKGMDEKLIEDEILKHKNKRFNVRGGWLPLDTKPDH